MKKFRRRYVRRRFRYSGSELDDQEKIGSEDEENNYQRR
jgi:hypothetical protein